MSPAGADRRPAKDRVQGIDSDLSHLTLRSERPLRVEIGGAIQPTPSLTRTIAGASSISLKVRDSAGDLFDSDLLRQKFDAKLDGLWFRYMANDFDGPDTTISLEERPSALLRELKGPKSALRKNTTRAEFIISLLREAKLAIPYHCPQLHVVQPIETKAQGKKAKEDAKANRGPGLGDAKHLTIEGVAATPSQIDLGDTAFRIAESVDAPYRVQVALFAALMDESRMGDAAPGNVLEASGGTTVRSAEEEIHGFLTGKPAWTGVSAIGYYREHPDAEFFEIAQAVQKSGAGEGSGGQANYGKFGADAREWLETCSGGATGSSSRTVTEPYTFEVGKDEDYWEAIKRLAKEVNWRAFFVAGRFFLIDEQELARGMVRLAIQREAGSYKPKTRGVLRVKGKYNANRPATEIELEVLAKQWQVPPGAVITLEGYGAASLGFGDAPTKADAKGRKVGLSQNREARSGVGRARYIVESIESPLRDDAAKARIATVKLKRPTAPLPEPAAKTKTVSTANSTGVGGMGALDGTPEDIVNQVVEYAHDKLGFDVTPESVRQANATHGPTVDGNISDHQGPPNVRWAADISNGTSTPEEAQLAAAIAEAFDIPYHGTRTTGELADATHGGYRFQLIHNTMTGGDHYNHVHFGVAVA